MDEEIDTESSDDSAYYAALRRFHLAKRNLIRSFHEKGEVNLSVASLTKESIRLDVEIKYHGEHGFAYLIEEVAESYIYLWKDDIKIDRRWYYGTKPSMILISMGPNESFTLSFTGYFKDGKLYFTDTCIFPEIGNSFDVTYEFLKKLSNRVTVVIPE